MAQTSKESVEKKFKGVFERSPGAFPEGTSLEEKVNYSLSCNSPNVIRYVFMAIAGQ